MNNTREYRICVKCVMDTSDPKITFSTDGICDHCRNFENHTALHWLPNSEGRKVLEKKVEKIKRAGKNSQFDCIIGISGGADSSYLTYLAKEELGLRPLVFHVDAGWNSEVAVSNIERIIDGLGLELYTHVINWREMRDLQLAFFKSGVPHIDLPQDHAFFATMYRYAETHRVKYILTGANIATECVRNPLDFFYYGTDMWQIRDIHNQFGSGPLIDFPLSGILRHKIYLRYIRGIEVVQPLDYMPYVKEEAMSFLNARYGWQKYPRKHFESRFTRFFESYWLPVKFGFDTRRVQYSSLILTKQMTRDNALELLKEPPYDAETAQQDLIYIAKKLEVSVDEIRGYLNGPNKSYKDFRNQQYLFLLGAKAMAIMGLERRAIKR